MFAILYRRNERHFAGFGQSPGLKLRPVLRTSIIQVGRSRAAGTYTVSKLLLFALVIVGAVARFIAIATLKERAGPL